MPLATGVGVLVFLVTAELGFLLTACGQSREPTSGPVSVAAPKPVPGPLVTYRESGGIAGRIDHLVVHGDGGTELSTNLGGSRQFKLSSAVMNELRSKLADAHFERLRRSYRRQPYPDIIEMSISHGGRTVYLSYGPEIPAQLRPLVELLGDIVQDNERRPHRQQSPSEDIE